MPCALVRRVVDFFSSVWWNFYDFKNSVTAAWCCLYCVRVCIGDGWSDCNRDTMCGIGDNVTKYGPG